jgi:hypothetical protein
MFETQGHQKNKIISYNYGSVSCSQIVTVVKTKQNCSQMNIKKFNICKCIHFNKQPIKKQSFSQFNNRCLVQYTTDLSS